jgi:biopolymer transport protein ExbB
MRLLAKFSIRISLAVVFLIRFHPFSTAQETTSQSDSASVRDTLNSKTTVEEREEIITELPDERQPEEVEENLHQVIRSQFINGDWRFMTPVLLCLLIGLVIAIERIVRLNLATSSVDRTLVRLRDDLEDGGVAQAMESLEKKRNSVAMIFRQSLEKWPDGIEVVEKAIIS